MKSRAGQRPERRERSEERRVEEKRVRRKKMEMREKVGKSRFTVFFQWFVAPDGRKVGSLKRRVRSQLARWEMKICTPLWREAHFEVKNVQNTPCADHFWKLRCRKKCTPLWREAHFQVKMYKTHHVRTSFGGSDVEKVHAVVARSTFQSQKTPGVRTTFGGSDLASLRFTTLHYITLHYTPLHSTTLHYTYTTFHYTPLH